MARLGRRTAINCRGIQQQTMCWHVVEVEKTAAHRDAPGQAENRRIVVRALLNKGIAGTIGTADLELVGRVA